MKCKKIEREAYNIYLIKNSGFHTIDLRVYFTENASRRINTERLALINMMTYATKKYPTKKDLLNKCKMLYSMYPSGLTIRHGKLMSTSFSISTIDSKYIKDQNIKDNIYLLGELIFNPLIENQSFNQKYYDIVINELKAETKTIDEDPKLLANYLMINNLDDGKGEILTGFSDLDILDKITPKSLYQSYQEMINNSRIDIYVSGNIKNEDEIVKTIDEVFTLKKRKIDLAYFNIIHKDKNKKVKYVVRKGEYAQSKLCLGYKFIDLTPDESRYVANLMNNIIANDMDSLTMQIIREKHSMCYYATSYVNRLDNLYVLNLGINKENYENVMKLINEIMDYLISGKITKREVEKSKATCIVELETMMDNNANLINYWYGRELFDSEDIKIRLDKIKKIKREDIQEFAKKMKLDTVFFLEGEL